MSASAHQAMSAGANAFAPSARLAQLGAMSRGELEAMQLERLQRQLARLHQSSSYYRSRMD
jgi:phenylacetate-coenzyme A ligase PaaK-like adenylate-forming protein